jgi:hypothetical protein
MEQSLLLAITKVSLSLISKKAVKNTCLTTKATTGLHQEREPCLTAITFHKTVFFQKNTRTPASNATKMNGIIHPIKPQT